LLKACEGYADAGVMAESIAIRASAIAKNIDERNMTVSIG
jgi:hypothetical protein